MVSLIRESNDCSNYKQIVKNAIYAAKRDGYNQIVYVDEDGQYGIIRAGYHDEPVVKLRPSETIVGKVRVIYRNGIRDAVYITDTPARESVVTKYKPFIDRNNVNEASSHNYKKWTNIFNDFLDTVGISVSWDPDKKAFYLEDLQGTLSFDDDYKKETQVVERLYGLAEDYIAQDLDEESDEYGITEFDEFNVDDPRFLDNWYAWYADFDIDAKDPEYIKAGKEFIKDHEAEFEWASLFCNHADDVDLNYLKKK